MISEWHLGMETSQKEMEENMLWPDGLKRIHGGENINVWR